MPIITNNPTDIKISIRTINKPPSNKKQFACSKLLGSRIKMVKSVDAVIRLVVLNPQTKQVGSTTISFELPNDKACYQLRYQKDPKISIKCSVNTERRQLVHHRFTIFIIAHSQLNGNESAQFLKDNESRKNLKI